MAAYSYDAGEDNEISFKEGDRITHIEAASEDWWQGTDKNGNVGLFPGECCSVRRFGQWLTLIGYSELRRVAGLRLKLVMGSTMPYGG